MIWAGSTAIVPSAAKPLLTTGATPADAPPSKTDFAVTVGPLERGKDVLSDFLKEPATWGAAVDGAIAGGLLAQAALKIDPHVLRAIEFSTANHLHGCRDLWGWWQSHLLADIRGSCRPGKCRISCGPALPRSPHSCHLRRASGG